MRDHALRHFGFLKTTAIGGIVFLLPLIVVGWLVGQAAYYAWLAIDAVGGSDVLPVHTPWGYALLLLATLGAVVVICFVMGLVARQSLGRWFTERAERYLLMLFPRYAVFKDQLTGELGGESGERLKPVLVRMGAVERLGVEVERSGAGRVTVYLPSSPDPWTGEAILASAKDVRPIRVEVGQFMAIFEQLGRGAARHADRAE